MKINVEYTRHTIDYQARKPDTEVNMSGRVRILEVQDSLREGYLRSELQLGTF